MNANLKNILIEKVYNFPLKFFFPLVLLLLYLDYSIFNTKLLLQLSLFFATISITILYFSIFYLIIDRKRFNKFSRLEISNYTKFQLKVVFLEELLLRYTPLVIIILFTDYEIVGCFIFSLIFTFLHFYKFKEIPIFVCLEFFIFFLITSIFFVKYETFLILFMSHFLRNIIINKMRK